MEIIEEKWISWNEAKKILEKTSKEKELGYEQKNALDHLKKFSKLAQKNEKELEEQLKKTEKLKERHIVSIINMLPKDDNELKVVLANEIINLSEDERKKIVSIVKKFS